jgi:type I restriction enzyme, S subunit
MMKPYPAYKDSGLEWLGKIPAHWTTKRVKYLFHEIDERSQEGEESLLSVSQYTGVTIRGIENNSRKAESLSGYRICHPGDFVSNIMLAWLGAFGVSNHHGIVSPAYCVYRLKQNQSPKFFDYLFHTPQYLAEIARNSTGVIQSRWRLYTDDFFRIFSLLPPREEQNAIVAFLEEKTAVIDKFISNKRRLIGLLEEQKQAVINTAVTQGLDTAVARKPSGIDWLGDIPAHWEIKKLKYLVDFFGGATPSKDKLSYWNGSIPWVSPKDMKRFWIDDTEDHITLEGLSNSSCSIIPSLSVLLVVRSGILQHTIPCSINRCDITLNQDMKALIPKGEIQPVFLAHFIKGNQNNLLQEWRKIGATVESIEHQFLSGSYIAIPPLPEQMQIINYIEEKTAVINTTIKRAQREITLIEEYRTTLIAHAVTGKIDIRPGASHATACVAPPNDN